MVSILLLYAMYIDWPPAPKLLDWALILIVAYVSLRFLRRSRAAAMTLAVIAIALLCWLLVRYKLSAYEAILSGFLTNLPILIIVLFQPEIRQAFISFGDRMHFRLLARRHRRGQFGAYDEIVLAAATMASVKMGALIVIERDISLSNIADGGLRMDAELSYDLLVTTFNPATPLHDGAVIVRGNRVIAAACFTSLTINPRLSKDLGTRHRAAIGISEDTDAVAIVVSEETGLISFTKGGQITRGLDPARLRALIYEAIEAPARRAEQIKSTQGEA